MTPDAPKSSKPLSEIGHLFLSSVRDRQTAGAQRPARTPPPKAAPRDVSVDLTPEEYAGVFGSPDAATRAAPVSAVLAGHLGGNASDRTHEYARHLAGEIGRVGLMELDGSEFRLTCIERSVGTTVVEPGPTLDASDPRHLQEAIEELNWDVSRWLIALPTPRTPEARNLLRLIDDWVLLCTGDHDGVVCCYRTLKGLADLHTTSADDSTEWPRLSLAVLGALDASQAKRLTNKLAGVCEQFLAWHLDENAVAVRPNRQVAEHLLLSCRPTRDKGQIASAPHWQIVGDQLTKMKQSQDTTPAETAQQSNIMGKGLLEASDQSETEFEDASSDIEHVGDLVVASRIVATEANDMDASHPTATSPANTGAPSPLPEDHEPAASIEIAAEAAPTPIFNTPDTTASARLHMTMTPAQSNDLENDVLDLPGGATTDEAIIAAVLGRSGDMIKCPVKAPACPTAELAVGRDRTLTMLAVANVGLTDLRAIARAWQWLNENRQLIAMAMPQLSIDACSLPRLQLLVDHHDVSAELLQPLLAVGHVSVTAYRTLKWGGKTGLLLVAA